MLILEWWEHIPFYSSSIPPPSGKYKRFTVKLPTNPRVSRLAAQHRSEKFEIQSPGRDFTGAGAVPGGTTNRKA